MTEKAVKNRLLLMSLGVVDRRHVRMNLQYFDSPRFRKLRFVILVKDICDSSLTIVGFRLVFCELSLFN